VDSKIGAKILGLGDELAQVGLLLAAVMGGLAAHRTRVHLEDPVLGALLVENVETMEHDDLLLQLHLALAQLLTPSFLLLIGIIPLIDVDGRIVFEKLFLA